MTTRERILTVLQGGQPDRVPWAGDLSYWVGYLGATGQLQAQYQGGEGFHRLHRDLGVGFYLQGDFPFETSLDNSVKIETKVENDSRQTIVTTPAGTLRQTTRHLPDSYCDGYVEHFVKSQEDLPALRHWIEHTQYRPNHQVALERGRWAGDNGVVLCYLQKSPLMELIALLAGIEAVTFTRLDAPREFEETLRVMERKFDEANEIALNSSAECLMIPENLSAEVVGKELFEKYMRPYEERWIRRIRAAGKHSFVHMDGSLKGLLREVASTGFTVLEALTPHPVGDVPIEEIRGYVTPKTVIWGGLPGVYFTDLVDDAEFDTFVRRVLEVMKSEPRYVLGVADQVPPKSRWERVRRVGELVEKHGRYK